MNLVRGGRKPSQIWVTIHHETSEYIPELCINSFCSCMIIFIIFWFLLFKISEVLHPPSFSAFDNSNINIEADGAESEHAFDTHSDTRDNEVTSGTLSSPDISDHELHTEDLSHDDSAEHIECRERRDSGVGSSLTRTSR